MPDPPDNLMGFEPGQTWLIVLLRNTPETLPARVVSLGRRFATLRTARVTYRVDFKTGEVHGERAEVYRNQADWEASLATAAAWRRFRDDLALIRKPKTSLDGIALARRALGMSADPAIAAKRQKKEA